MLRRALTAAFLKCGRTSSHRTALGAGIKTLELRVEPVSRGSSQNLDSTKNSLARNTTVVCWSAG